MGHLSSSSLLPIRADKCGTNDRQEEESLGRVCTSIICFVGTAKKRAYRKLSVYLEGSRALVPFF